LSPLKNRSQLIWYTLESFKTIPINLIYFGVLYKTIPINLVYFGVLKKIFQLIWYSYESFKKLYRESFFFKKFYTTLHFWWSILIKKIFYLFGPRSFLMRKNFYLCIINSHKILDLLFSLLLTLLTLLTFI